jgi:uncharacterized protein
MQKKTIWYDITHPAQLNFYLNSIKKLSLRYNILVTVVDRGKLPAIAKKELGGIENTRFFVVGKHRGGRFSAIFEANFLRLAGLFLLLLQNKIHLHFSNGYQGSLLSKLFGFRAVTFGDDPDSIDYRLKLVFSDKVFFCLYSSEFIEVAEKATILPLLKEWAYLNPDYFLPDKNQITKYGLNPYQYLFVREVTTGTLNYSKQKYGLIAELAGRLPKELPVLFSLEDKVKRDMYPENWILIQEPVDDIHSLIYFSRALISSGDSMAREGAVLGLPSFYIGTRKMAANEVLRRFVQFYQVKVEEFDDIFKGELQRFNPHNQLRNIQLLRQKFMDINVFIFQIAEKALESP